MRQLSSFCIKRPAFTIVLSLLLCAIGILGYSNLQIRYLPKVAVPVISISTDYPGASAELVDTSITLPLDNALEGITGLDYTSTQSMYGHSQITIYFHDNTSINSAVEQVRAAVARAKPSLPNLSSISPQVLKQDPNAAPTFIIAFSDASRPISTLSDYIVHQVEPQFENLYGVGSTIEWGTQHFAMRVDIDPAKLAAHHLTTNDVLAVLKTQNVSIPSGQLRTPDRYITLNTDTNLQDPQQFAKLIVADSGDHVVHLGEVARIYLGAEHPDVLFRVNGHPGVALGFVPQADANQLQMAQGLEQQFKQMQQQLPQGLKANIVYNTSIFTKASITSVWHTILEAILLVLLVVLCFIGNWRATLIPIITIPICLIANFFLLQLFGFSINTMTLLAMVLAVGLVVDDAIVMLENISGYCERGLAPYQAAIQGSGQITFAIIAMTLTLIAVYIPLGFAHGVTSVFFRQFAFSLAGTIIISGFVALTLSPMMCAYILPPQRRGSAYSSWLEKTTHRLQQGYQRSLSAVLKFPKVIFIAFIVLLCATYACFRILPKTIAPPLDTNTIGVHAQAPPDASFDYLKRAVPDLEKQFKGVPGIQSYLTQIPDMSPMFLMVFVPLIPQAQRQQTDTEILATLQQRLAKVSGMQIIADIPPPPLAMLGSAASASSGALMLGLSSSLDYPQLHAISQQFMQKLQKYPGITNLNQSLQWNTEQITLKIQRAIAAKLQVPLTNIAAAISTLYGGQTAGYFYYGSNRYPVIPKMQADDLRSTQALNQIFVKNTQGKLIPLSSLITLSRAAQPANLMRLARMHADMITASLAPGYSLNQVIPHLQQLAQHNLPASAQMNFYGQGRQYLQNSNTMAFLLIAGIVFIYLVLVAQFESFKDPLIILLTIPVAILGAFLSLWLTGNSLNFYSEIGLVTLVGLITKNGILIVEFANQKLTSAASRKDAVINAAASRLRPILMTSCAMVLGALPLAWAHGAGAANRQQIGWVIVGGLVIGTFFTLYIVPAAYLWCRQAHTPLQSDDTTASAGL